MVFGHAHQHLVHPILVFLTVAHDFDVKIIPKLLFPPQKGFFRLFFPNIENFVGYLTIQVSGKGNYIFLVLLYDLFVDSRYIIKTIGIGYGGHFGQIVISFFVFGQQHNLMPVVLYIFIGVVLTNVEFATHNGRNLFFGGPLAIGNKFFIFGFYRLVVRHHFFHKVKGPHHIGVVGKGNGGHAMIGRGLDQIFDVDGGLEHRELGMVVQMNKGFIFQCFHIFLYFLVGNATRILCPKGIGNFF